MIRAVLDSSVLVGASVKPDGASAALLARAWEGAFALCLSREIVAETAGSLLKERHQRRLRFGPERVEGELPRIRAVSEDPKDDAVVASAVAADAGYLVTGDRRHLLPLGSHGVVRIVLVAESRGVLEAARRRGQG